METNRESTKMDPEQERDFVPRPSFHGQLCASKIANYDGGRTKLGVKCVNETRLFVEWNRATRETKLASKLLAKFLSSQSGRKNSPQFLPG